MAPIEDSLPSSVDRPAVCDEKLDLALIVLPGDIAKQIIDVRDLI